MKILYLNEEGGGEERYLTLSKVSTKKKKKKRNEKRKQNLSKTKNKNKQTQIANKIKETFDSILKFCPKNKINYTKVGIRVKT